MRGECLHRCARPHQRRRAAGRQAQEAAAGGPHLFPQIESPQRARGQYVQEAQGAVLVTTSSRGVARVYFQLR